MMRSVRLLYQSSSCTSLYFTPCRRYHIPCTPLAATVRNMTLSPARRVQVVEQATLQKDSLSGKRLCDILVELFPGRFSSATAAKNAVRRKEVQVNGSIGRTDSLMKQGDLVQIVVKVGNGAVWPSAEGKPGLDVAYEDDHMACIVKPQGLPTQGKGENTVQGRIKYCLTPSPLPGALFRPHHVHRLDAVTGGLVLVAKTRVAAATLAGDLAAHNMQKRYLALVLGCLEGSGIIDYPLEGKPALSLFRAEAHSQSESFGVLTWLSLWPKTGRTHQLRKHCAYIGHPILGDMQYKLHRKADCQVTPVQDVQQYLPQLNELAAAAAPAVLKVEGCSAACTAQDALVLQAQHDKQQQGLEKQHTDQQQQQHGCIDTLEIWQQGQHAVARTDRLPGQQLLPVVEPQLKQLRQVPGTLKVQQQEMPQHHADGGQKAPCQSAGPADQPVAAAEAADHAPGLFGNSSSMAADHADHTEDSFSLTMSEAAADDVGGTAAGGCRQQRQLLQDGSSARTCLWAVQLQLLHPITRQPMDLHIQEQAVKVYKLICSTEAPPVAAASG